MLYLDFRDGDPSLLLTKYGTCCTIRYVSPNNPLNLFPSYYIHATQALSRDCALFCATAAR